MSDTETAFADLTFHAIEFRDRQPWVRTKEQLLRFLNSNDGRKRAAELNGPVVVLASRIAITGRPLYLHVTDGGLTLLKELGLNADVRATAFYEELPTNQVLLFKSD